MEAILINFVVIALVLGAIAVCIQILAAKGIVPEWVAQICYVVIGIAFVIVLLTQLLLPLIHHTPLLTG